MDDRQANTGLSAILTRDQRTVLRWAYDALSADPRADSFYVGTYDASDDPPEDDPEFMTWVEANADIIRRFLASDYGRIGQRLNAGRRDGFPLRELKDAKAGMDD